MYAPRILLRFSFPALLFTQPSQVMVAAEKNKPCKKRKPSHDACSVITGIISAMTPMAEAQTANARMYETRHNK